MNNYRYNLKGLVCSEHTCEVRYNYYPLYFDEDIFIREIDSELIKFIDIGKVENVRIAIYALEKNIGLPETLRFAMAPKHF